MAMANAEPTSGSIDWAKLEAQAHKRLVWKEGRLLLPACLALIILAVIGMIAWGLYPASQTAENAEVFVGLALAGATMSALVCGCMAFAPERETGTDAFLARLPLDGTRLARTKIFSATVYFFVSYFISVACAVALFAVFFNGQNLLSLIGGTGVLGAMLPVAFLMPAIVFLWSLAFSRYQSSTLSAVVSAGACAVVVPVVVAFLVTLAVDFLKLPDSWAQVILFAMFPIKIVALLIAIAYQHGAWLRPSTVESGRLTAVTDAKVVLSPVRKSRFAGSMHSLLWQTFRMHWLGTLVAALVCGLYTAAVLLNYSTVVLVAGTEWPCFAVEYMNDLFAAAIGAVTGIFLFAKDQRQGSYRFFQQRADYPRRVWLARITGMVVIGAIVVLVVGLVNQVAYSTTVAQFQTLRMGQGFGAFDDSGNVFATNVGFGPQATPTYLVTEFSLVYFYWLSFRTTTMFFVVAAVGQLVSIFCRHGILNALLGVVFCFAVTFWIRYINWYQVPTWAYAWPIGLAAFGLSWAYAPSWIRGTRKLSWSVFSVVVMSVVIVSSVICLRADRLNDFKQHAYFTELEELYLNPEKLKANGDSRFDVTRKIESAIRPINLAWDELQDQGQGSSPDEKNELRFSDAELDLVDEHADAFEEIAGLVLDPDVRHFFAQSPDAAATMKNFKSESLFRLLDLYSAAKKKKGEDQFDAIVVRYALNVNSARYPQWKYLPEMLDWGESEDRTVAELNSAIAKFNSLLATKENTGELMLEHSYFGLLKRYYEYQNGLFAKHGSSSWEIERSKRRFANDLLVDFNKIYPSAHRQTASLRSLYGARTIAKSNWKLMAPMRVEYANFHVGGLGIDDRQFELHQENQLQYVKVRYALAAWKLDNGSYPEQLSQLGSDYISKKMVEDYVTSQWAYYPKGLDKPVVLNAPYNQRRFRSDTNIATQAMIPVNTPFFLPWRAVPAETISFVTQTKIGEGTEVVEGSELEVGYLMGAPVDQNFSWYLGEYIEEFILTE